MDLITRYPLEEFSFKNLDILQGLGESLEKLIVMLDNLFSLLRPTLS